MPSFRSELRKLLSVRSTYMIIIISLAVVGLFAGFGDGFRATAPSLQHPDLLMKESANGIVYVGLILAFAGLLLVGHEYRYNTIMYSLTVSNRRLKVLFSKLLVITLFAVIMSLIVAFFSPLCTIIGANLHGYHIAPQHFDYWAVIWHSAFVGWGYAMYAFVLVVIMRSQVGSIVTFLLVPLIGENIISHIFSNSSNYLPFTMLQAVAAPMGMGNHTTTNHAVSVVLIYIAAGLLISAVLFRQRDAN